MAMDLLGKLRRAAKKPPSYIAQRLWHETLKASDRWRAPSRAAAATPERVLAALGHASLDAAWDSFLSRPYPFLSEHLSTQLLQRLAPGELERILTEAENASTHRVDLLGSGLLELGPEIDWLCDAKTGYRWPKAHAQGIEYANLDRPSDVKFPWELSRLQWLIPAGQAWHLTGEQKYAETVRQVLESFLEANPYGGSVNWSCTMEVALRLFTISWLIRACGRSQPFADPGFRWKLIQSLYLHAEYTERHIERSDINGNHYTADAAGLVIAGAFLGDGPAPSHWLQQGWRFLEAEILLQVHPDGVDFEASLPYHRLVMELFLLPALYGQAVGIALPNHWRDRLLAMARFVSAYSRQDGTLPVWGDNDDARALPMAGKGLHDHRYLLHLVALGLSDPETAELAQGPVAECLWWFGHRAEALATRPPRPLESKAFPDGGFFILARNLDHVFVDCGPIGLAGRGGHGHNDLMSFEAALNGQRLVVDSGCFVYTASPEERNAFRSTDYHNTPMIGGAEVNRFERPDYLWTLMNDAKHQCLAFEAGEEFSRIHMRHSGYQRLSPPVTPEREIILDHRSSQLSILDRFHGHGQSLSVPLHLAPDVEARILADGRLRLRTPKGEFCLDWTCSGNWSFAIEPSRFAPSYGVIQPSTRLVWRIGDCGGAWLTVKIVQPKADRTE